MKVTLFFGFGHFLVVKMLFQLPENRAHVGPRGSSRLEPNEVGPSLRGSFLSYLSPIQFILKSKKIDSPYCRIVSVQFISDFKMGCKICQMATKSQTP